MNTLTIVRKIDVIRALLIKDRDNTWIKKKELEVREGLRREALNHGR